MRPLHISLLFPAFIAVACATPDSTDTDVHDALALSGVILFHSNIPATYRTPRAGMGAIAAAIVEKIPEKRAYFVYVVKREDGRERVVYSTQEFKDGECIDVFVNKRKLNAPSWDRDDLTLKPSTACKA